MGGRKNLLAETLSVLKACNKLPGDVCGVVSGRGGLTWDEFAGCAKDVVYDSGFGSVHVSLALKIVGDTWWLERAECDGAESWEFKTMPEPSAEHVPPEQQRDCILECPSYGDAN